MQIKQYLLVSVAALALSVVTARADVYTFNDFDNLSGNINNPLQIGASISDVFNIVASDGEGNDSVGYAPGTTINAAQVWFTVSEPGFTSPSGYMMATLAPSGVTPGTAVYTAQAVGTGTYGADILSLVASLNLTSGIIDYTITAVSGEFVVESADLRVWTVGFPDPEFAIPDGGATAGLLLLGLASVVPFRKRFAA